MSITIAQLEADLDRVMRRIFAGGHDTVESDRLHLQRRIIRARMDRIRMPWQAETIDRSIEDLESRLP